MQEHAETAERVRTVLAAASSAAVTSETSGKASVPMWVREEGCRLSLWPTTDDPAVTQRMSDVRVPLPALVEVADVAPVPLRERIRARVHIFGTMLRAELESSPMWHCIPESVFMIEDGALQQVPLRALADAHPDPFALAEAAYLGHLDAEHHDSVAELGELVDDGLMHDVQRFRPLRLDRHGVVLRLEYTDFHRDVRLAFPEPVRNPQQLANELQTLLARARDTRHRRRAVRRT